MACVVDVVLCVSLGSMYVGSLYIWRNTLGRDHPTTIKKRFISVFLMTLVSAVYVHFSTDYSYFKQDNSFWSLIGLRIKGVLPALFIPLFLTMVLFSGPLLLHYLDGFYYKAFAISITFIKFVYHGCVHQSTFQNYIESWKYCVCNVIWLRNHIVAPFSEEFTFRACMLPILVPCFGVQSSIFLCPFFFGIAHLHHLKERLVHGTKFKIAIFQSLFQFAYTTVFGAYSSYLFLRTGHFIAPFIVHAFCNHMGFPDFSQLLNYGQPTRTILMAIFLVGLVSWIMLLEPFTDPKIYSNNMYW